MNADVQKSLATAMGFSLVGMGRQFIMGMLANPMVMFPGRSHRINVNNGVGQIGQVMQELVSNFPRDFMTRFHRKIALHCNIDIRQHAMPQPSHSHVRHLYDARYMIGSRVFDLIDDLGINSIQEAIDKGFSRIPNDLKNDDGDHKTNEGIGLRIPQPDTDGAEQNP